MLFAASLVGGCAVVLTVARSGAGAGSSATAEVVNVVAVS